MPLRHQAVTTQWAVLSPDAGQQARETTRRAGDNRWRSRGEDEDGHDGGDEVGNEYKAGGQSQVVLLVVKE